MPSSFDVFLSHNSTDKEFIRQLGEALQQRGLAVWLDEWNLIPGRDWQQALEDIITTTKSAVVAIGKDGLGPWELPEMRACLSEVVDRNLPVIPVLLPDVPRKPELPLFLRRFLWVDLRKGLTAEGLDLLEWGITGIKPTAAGRAPKLEMRLGALGEAYARASGELMAASTDKERRELKKKIDELNREMEAIDRQMKDLQATRNDPHFHHRQLLANLPKLDFKEVGKALDTLFKKAGRDGWAAIFLVQKGLSFGGEHCATRIRDLLNERTGNLKHWKLDFALGVGGSDESGFVSGLAEYLNVAGDLRDLPQFTQQVVNKMCNSLSSGNIGFLDVRGWDNLQPLDRVMAWFFDTFWQTTIDSLKVHTQRHTGVKLVALLVVDYEIPAECLPAMRLANVKQWENGKMLLFSLKKWSKKDIDDWLVQYSGLTKERIDALNRKIGNSGGLPLEVCELLKKELAR